MIIVTIREPCERSLNKLVPEPARLRRSQCRRLISKGASKAVRELDSKVDDLQHQITEQFEAIDRKVEQRLETFFSRLEARMGPSSSLHRTPSQYSISRPRAKSAPEPADSIASSPGIQGECTPQSAPVILKCHTDARQPSPHSPLPLPPSRIASVRPPPLQPLIPYDPPRLLPPTDRLATLQITKGKTVTPTLTPLPLPLRPPQQTQLTRNNLVRPRTNEVTPMDYPGPSRPPDPNPAVRFKPRPAPDPSDHMMRPQLIPQARTFDPLYNQLIDQFPGLTCPLEVPAPTIVSAGQRQWQQPRRQITAPGTPLLPLPSQPFINIGEPQPCMTTTPMITGCVDAAPGNPVN